MIFNTPDGISAITQQWTGERLEDGRPKVDSDILERMKLVTNEEAWGVLERGHNYHYQYEGNWQITHPDVPMAGRAVTAQMIPLRPDFNDYVLGVGQAEGRVGSQNNWVIDSLQEGDVLVVDMFGKVHDGTFVGDNLTTAARAKTGTGLVLHCGIRDYARIMELDDFPVFHRGVDPTAIYEVTLVGVNIPIRVGNATVLPGDVVLGTKAGVTFVPPHLAGEVVDRSEDTRQRDVFGKSRLADGVYPAGEIDTEIWKDEIVADYANWCQERGLVVHDQWWKR